MQTSRSFQQACLFSKENRFRICSRIGTAALLLLMTQSTLAQGVRIRSGNPSVPSETTAVLQLDATDKGFLMPRMTYTQFEAMPARPRGLAVIITDSSDTAHSGMYMDWSAAGYRSRVRVPVVPPNVGNPTIGVRPLTPAVRTEDGSLCAKDICVEGNVELPATGFLSSSRGGINGVINSGGLPILHRYGTRNLFAGISAGNFGMTGTDNTGVGYQSLIFMGSGSGNTAVGSSVLHGYGNNSGSRNTGIGTAAAYLTTSGNDNVAVGWSSLYFNNSGSGNTAVGSNAYQNLNTGLSNNTALGYNAQVNGSSTTNATAIGANAIVAQSNSMTLGGTGANAVKVGIGTTTPVSTLQVSGGNFTFENSLDHARQIRNTYDIEIRHDTDNDNTNSWVRVWHNDLREQFRIEDAIDANILGDGAFVGNGLDYAEAFKVSQPGLVPGDVVSLAIGNWEYCKQTSVEYDGHILGVVSEKPGFVCGLSFDAENLSNPSLAQARDVALATGNDAEAKRITVQLSELARQQHRPIALVGRVPCKVVGPVKAGDFLTSSNIAGCAMKMTMPGPSLGIALEDWSGSAQGKIIVMVQPSWRNPNANSIPSADSGQSSTQELKSRLAELERVVAAITKK